MEGHTLGSEYFPLEGLTLLDLCLESRLLILSMEG